MVFYLTYIVDELRRRRGRTILTSLGIAVGIGLVVTVSSLSNGIDRAQQEVLKPLTGVGTDASVTRPLLAEGDGERFSTGGNQLGRPQLSSKERKLLIEENKSQRVPLTEMGDPGEKFETDRFISATQLSFPSKEVDEIEKLPGIKDASGALTLNVIHLEGTIPEDTQGSRGRGGGFGGGPPESVDTSSFSAAGVDVKKPDIAPLTPGQITEGKYLSTDPKQREAVLNKSYAGRSGISIGDKTKIGGKSFKVVGLSSPPIGGQASDFYVQLSELQKLSDRKGRVNVVQVRANDAAAVAGLPIEIDKVLPGAQVTTSEELADRVGGSIIDAKSLSDKLSLALSVVALIAAVMIASLLTLSSVSKRMYELGTLRAVGWSRWKVVRQVAGESLVLGLIGGALGIVLGIAGIVVIDAIGPSLTATVTAPDSPAGPIGAIFGQGQVAAGSERVTIDASLSVGLLGAAIGLAVIAGLIAGAIGGLRAARLRPAEALRQVE